MAFASRHPTLVTAFVLIGSVIASADMLKVCFLGTEEVSDLDGRVRFVQRPRDPRACDEVRLGGHNIMASRTHGATDVNALPPPESTPEATTEEPPWDCQDILDAGNTASDVYFIYPGGTATRVYCYMKSDTQQGYIVFQKRFDGSVSFDKNWSDYKNGFGNLDGEVWLGLSLLKTLTATDKWELVIKLESFRNEVAYAYYSSISVSGIKYDLDVDGYASMGEIDPGDALSPSHQRFFTTRDQDNDNSGGLNCAAKFKGGWWYKKCNYLDSNLNGEFGTGETVPEFTGIQWKTWHGRTVALRACEMRIRRNPSS